MALSRSSRSSATCLLAAAFLASPLSAGAAGPELGLVAGADRGRVECVDGFACDRSSGFVQARLGWRFDSGVDLTLHALNSGRFKGGDTTDLGSAFGGTFKVRAVGLTAGWRWAIARGWDLGVRAGVAAVRARFDYDDDAWSTRGKTTAQPLVGVGIGYAITPQWRLGLDLDATRLEAHREHGALQMFGASVRYAF